MCTTVYIACGRRKNRVTEILQATSPPIDFSAQKIANV